MFVHHFRVLVQTETVDCGGGECCEYCRICQLWPINIQWMVFDINRKMQFQSKRRLNIYMMRITLKMHCVIMGLLVGSFGAPLPFYFIFSLVWVRWIVKRATRICHPQPDKPKAIKYRVKFIRGLEFNVPPTTAQSTVTVGPCWFGLESHEIKHTHTHTQW